MSCCFQADLESDPKHYSFEYDDDVDYDKEAQEMFQKFMSSTKVETSAMSDLGMDKVTKKFKDPRPKMEQRHQIVSYLFVMATGVSACRTLTDKIKYTILFLVSMSEIQ